MIIYNIIVYDSKIDLSTYCKHCFALQTNMQIKIIKRVRTLARVGSDVIDLTSGTTQHICDVWKALDDNSWLNWLKKFSMSAKQRARASMIIFIVVFLQSYFSLLPLKSILSLEDRSVCDLYPKLSHFGSRSSQICTMPSITFYHRIQNRFPPLVAIFVTFLDVDMRRVARVLMLLGELTYNVINSQLGSSDANDQTCSLDEILDKMLKLCLPPHSANVSKAWFWFYDDTFRQDLLDPFDALIWQFTGGITKSERLASRPHAFISALAVISRGGYIHNEDIFNTNMARLTRCLIDFSVAERASSPPGSRNKLSPLLPWVRARIHASRRKKPLLKQMKALRDASENSIKSSTCRKVPLLACQHLFQSNKCLFEMLAYHCDVSKSCLLTKSASTDEEVLDEMICAGWKVIHKQTSCYEEMRRALKFKHDRPILVIDEGGKWITTLHRSKSLLRDADAFVCVEQTQTGIEQLRRNIPGGLPALKVPVYNVAQSDLKKNTESLLIGEDVVGCAQPDIVGLSGSIENMPSVIIGYGYIGQAVAKALRRRYADLSKVIYLMDTKPEVLQEAITSQDKLEVIENVRGISAAHLVWGCATCIPGRPALNRTDIEKLPHGTMLINCASGDYQFEYDGIPDIRTVQSASMPHVQHHVLMIDNKLITVLHGGIVINRTLDIPPAYIDLTRTLMFRASLFAITQYMAPRKTGLIKIPEDIQDDIISRVQKNLSNFGIHDLNNPCYDRMPLTTSCSKTKASRHDIEIWTDRLSEYIANNSRSGILYDLRRYLYRKLC